MASALSDLGERFRFNERLLALVTEGFSEADWATRPGGKGGTSANSAAWIVGHVAVHRRVIARAAGTDVPVEAWEEAFARGADAEAVPAGSPSPAALVAEVVAGGERIERAFAALPDEALSGAFPSRLVGGKRTLEDGLRFLYFHETYHLGQVGLIRRILGHAGFA
jgi:hypothetical protein